jgi:hypothetical protein
LLIYPNPAKEFFIIENDGLEQVELRIYDLNGKTMFQSMVTNREQVNISNYASGMYIIEMENVYRKLIIQ